VHSKLSLFLTCSFVIFFALLTLILTIPNQTSYSQSITVTPLVTSSLVTSSEMSTPTEIPTEFPSPTENYRFIESDDDLVLREGVWEFVDDEESSGGSYLLSGGSSQDDALVLAFLGTSVEIAYIALPNSGTLTIEVDNVALRTVVTQDIPTNYTQRAVVDYLEDKPHILRIYPSAGAIAIDGIQVGGAMMPLDDLQVNVLLMPDFMQSTTEFSSGVVAVIVRLPEDLPGTVLTVLMRNTLAEGLECLAEQIDAESVITPPDYNHNIVASIDATCDEDEVRGVYSEFVDSGEAIVFIYSIAISSEEAFSDLLNGFSVLAAGSFPTVIENNEPTINEN
jgi:hypothetical protein